MPLTSQAKEFLDAIAEQNPPAWYEMPTADAREVFSSWTDLFGEGPELDVVENRTLPGDIGVRLFAEAGQEPRPVVMYFHGGGWVLGNLQTHDALCRRIAKASGCTVIAVDYRLSPEHRFPGPLDDCYLATDYVADHPDQFGIDADRIAVMGDSAGGNLAVAVALRARDDNGPSIRYQVLIYPVIEPRFDSPSYEKFAEDHGLTRQSMQWFWQQYLGEQEETHLAVPSKADSLAGLPPAHIVTAEYDVLRDEGESFARQLTEAGVPTTSRRYDGNLHGFIHFAGMFDDGLAATKDIGQLLSAQLRALR